MKTIAKRLHYLVAGSLAGLMFLTALLSVAPAVANAAPFGPNDPVSTAAFYNGSSADRAVMWSQTQAAVGNDTSCNLTKKTLAEIQAGNWFDSYTAILGHHVEPSRGSASCANGSQWFTSLLSTAGISGDLSVVARQVFDVRNGEYVPKSNGLDILRAIIAGNKGTGEGMYAGVIPAKAPDDVVFAALYGTFLAEAACNAKEGSTGTPIWVPDPTTKTAVKKFYTFDKSNGAISVGLGLGLGTDTVDGLLECNTIATYLGRDQYAKAAALNPNGVGSEGLEGTGQDPNLECGTLANPLNWFLCPIVKGVVAAMGALDTAIINLLTVDQVAIFDKSTVSGAGYRNSWEVFRGFALAILVIAAIAMVIAQALGFEILDAYTIKKTLPRLIFAIIGIAMSWEIMKFFVVLTNDLGLGIRSVIYSAFTQGDELTVGLNELGAIAVVATPAILVMGIMALLSFVVTGILAILVAFLVLILRQLVVVVLIVFAPIAIACFILPNTQGVWKLWYESFTKAMLMFPVIMAFIAIGRVFAISSTSGVVGGTGVGGATVSGVAQLIAFAAYFLPYFLIPLTLRIAGGAMATLGGFTNNKSRGAFDRLSKYRGLKTADNAMRLKTGERFNNRALNTATARLSTPRLGLGARGREAYDQKMALNAGAFGQSDKGKSIMFKDNVLQAMSYGSAKEAENRLGDDFGMEEHEVKAAVAGVRANGGFGKARQVWAAKQLAATGTGYDNDAQMYATIARASDGNKELANSMWGEMRGTSERAGRNDLKASYGLGSSLLSDIIDNGDNRASAKQVGTQYQDRFAALGLDAARGVDGMSLARNKPVAIKNLMTRLDQSRGYHEDRLAKDQVDHNLSAVERQTSQVALGQIRAKMENMESNKVYGPEVNAEAVHGKREVVKPDQGLPYVVRNAGIEMSHADAKAAAINPRAGRKSRVSYQEESLSRQPYDPGRDGPTPPGED